MIPAPETVTNQISEMIIPFLEGKKATPLELRRIEHEIGKLMNSDPGVAHTFLGYVAAFRDKHEDVIKHFENALKLDGEIYVHLINYAQCLDFCGNKSKEALVVLRKAINFESDLSSIDLGVKLSRELSDEDSYKFFIEIRESVCGKIPDFELCATLDSLEVLMDERPDLITPMDEDLFAEALSLVEGMEL